MRPAVRSVTAVPPVAWSWSHLLLGLAYAAPASLLALVEPLHGAVLAVGVLPAAGTGLPGPRRGRVRVVAVGAAAGAAMALGAAAVAVSDLVAVVAVVLVCLAAGALAARRPGPAASLALALGAPLVGVGFAFDGPSAGLAAAALVVGGSVYAWLVSLAWPAPRVRQRVAHPATRAAAGPAGPPVPRAYGVQLALAGGVAATAGLAAGLDHPGWAATAALMVSRPRWTLLRARGVGRAVSVLLGAAVACGVAASAPRGPGLATVVVVAVAGATATSGSRWYVLPFFTTLLVLSLLLAQDTAPAAHWFVERVGETLLGVLVAAGAAWLTPRALRRAHPGGPGGRVPA